MSGSEWDGPVEDVPHTATVRRSERVFDGKVWDVRRDEVDLGAGETVTRDVVEHPGAVGVLALDDADRVLLVRQYRHPVRHLLWEAPAGLLDVAEEPALETAQRELWEETGHHAARWNVLVDFFNSPGGTTEAFRCYLARDLTAGEGERHVGEGEERDMPLAWVDLDEAVRLVLAGRLHNPSAVSGVLAAYAARAAGWSGLRPADAPWPQRFPAA